jgi:hypothetical protein
MVFLGFGKFARADRIYALEPLRGVERGGGRRMRVWIEGIADPIVASRTERTILHDMGQDAASQAPIIDDALDLAECLVAAVRGLAGWQLPRTGHDRGDQGTLRPGGGREAGGDGQDRSAGGK